MQALVESDVGAQLRKSTVQRAATSCMFNSYLICIDRTEHQSLLMAGWGLNSDISTRLANVSTCTAVCDRYLDLGLWFTVAYPLIQPPGCIFVFIMVETMIGQPLESICMKSVLET